MDHSTPQSLAFLLPEVIVAEESGALAALCAPGSAAQESAVLRCEQQSTAFCASLA